MENSDQNKNFFFGSIAGMLLMLCLGGVYVSLVYENKPAQPLPTWRFAFHGDTIYLDNGRAFERRTMYDFKPTDKSSYIQGSALFDTLKFTMITK